MSLPSDARVLYDVRADLPLRSRTSLRRREMPVLYPQRLRVQRKLAGVRGAAESMGYDAAVFAVSTCGDMRRSAVQLPALAAVGVSVPLSFRLIRSVGSASVLMPIYRL